MKVRKFAKTIAVISLVLVVTTAGCNVNNSQKARYDKTISLDSPLPAGSTVIAKTSYGSITVTGTDSPGCTVVADITVKAPTEEEASEIASRIEILLTRSGDTLTIEADKPKVKKNRSISISYKITLPTRTNIKCDSSYGSVRLTNITGTINTHTSYGKVNCDTLNGPITIDTSYGDINCKEITSANLKASSSYGDIKVDTSQSTPADLTARVITSYGSINFTTPPNFAGEVSMSTSYGSIQTDLPITIKGKISKTNINGTIGSGKGKLNLNTSYGSIKLR
ncbi:MAG: DUF4097 family beta strand repeat protein [Anaerohalosphaera sp.]|nr:DUF4097 family beta strand repeat protein [Anaerohalosphaera sp.]